MIKKFSIYAIALIPFGLIAGPLIAELLLIFVTISFLFLSSLSEKISFFKNDIFKIFTVFCLFIVLRSLFTDQVLISLKSSFFYFRFVIYLIAICYFLSIDEKSLNISYKIYTATIIILLIDSFIQILTGKNLLGFTPPSENLMRISSFFDDKFILGSFLQKILPVYLFLVYKNFQKNKRLLNLNLLLVTIMLIVTFRSGDRAPFALIMLYSFSLFMIFTDIRKKLLLYFTIFLIGASILSLQNNSIVDRNFKDTYNLVIDKADFWEKKYDSNIDRNLYIFSFAHEQHYRSGIKMFLDKPIFGHGVKMYRFKCSDYSINGYGCTTHPHNTYVQLLAETGIIGFGLLFFIFIRIITKLFKSFLFGRKINENVSLILLTGVFINIWPIIPTGSFFNNWLSVIYLLPLAYYFSEIKMFSIKTIK